MMGGSLSICILGKAGHGRGLKYISKRWVEEYWAHGQFFSRRRATLYYPDRIEKYVISTTTEAGWEPIRDEPGEPWPIPWVDKAGRPLGILGAHFFTPGQQSELWPGIGPQKVINKTVMDMLAAGDVAGFRILGAMGFWPTTDGLPPGLGQRSALPTLPTTSATATVHWPCFQPSTGPVFNHQGPDEKPQVAPFSIIN